MRSNSLHAVLCGFDPDDVPGVGTFYDFLKRTLDGPYRKPGEGVAKKSGTNAMKHWRNLKGEKDRREGDFDPNRTKSEVLSKSLLAKTGEPRLDGMRKILEDLLFQAGTVPSVEAGLLSFSDGLVVSRDGSIMETAASPRGKATCDRRSQGIYKCATTGSTLARRPLSAGTAFTRGSCSEIATAI